MKNMLGAQRPASTRKVLWIAVAAIVLVAALATAAFSQAVGGNANWYGMGSDNVMGMMPPSMPYEQKPERNPPQAQQVQAMRVAQSTGTASQSGPNCNRALPITIVHSARRQTFTYVSTKHGCVYTITRNGKAWLTVTYDGTYKLTDPNGTGALILELGIKPGLFPSGSAPGPIKVNSPPSSTH